MYVPIVIVYAILYTCHFKLGMPGFLKSFLCRSLYVCVCVCVCVCVRVRVHARAQGLLITSDVM